MDIEAALQRLVHAARKAFYLSEQLEALGYQDTPYSDLFGNIADAIYYLLGEKTETFDQSVTYHALYDDLLTNKERVRILMNAIKEPAQC